MKDELKYRYFISYAGNINGAFGLGNTEVLLKYPIRSLKDIECVMSIIEEKSEVDKLTILNYKEFKE